MRVADLLNYLLLLEITFVSFLAYRSAMSRTHCMIRTKFNNANAHGGPYAIGCDALSQ